MKQKQKFSQLLKPQSIAVIGASSTNGKVGNMIAKNILAHHFEGDVYFVNPRRKKILGKKSYATLSDIDTKIDCAIVVVPAVHVAGVIEDGVKNCKNFIVISAGFGESGPEGHNREMQLNAIAQKNDINILGPNCLGFLMPSLGLNASFAEGLPSDGHIALVSQSGALAVAMMDKAQEEYIGFSAVVSIGNKMHIGAAELVEYFVDDAQTHVIALYLEGVIRGPRFLEALAYAAKKEKRVIILKSGRSEDAQKAIALHTGSLAGSDDIFSAALAKVGAIRTNSMDEFFAAILLGSHISKNLEARMRFGIVTNAGGPGVLATDVIARKTGVLMSNLTDETKKVLQKKLPVAASVYNPVDILGDASIERYEDGISTILKDVNVDIALILLTPQDQTPVDAVAKLLVAIQEKTHKIIIASFIGGKKIAGAMKILREGGVLHFTTPYQAINAVAQFTKNYKTFSLKETPVNGDRRNKMREIFAQKDGKNGLYFEEIVKVAKIYDINISRFTDITNGIDAKMHIKYPCVVKIDNPQILHKTDRGGVIVPIKTLVELDRARKTLLRSFPEKDSRVIVQPLLPIKTELIIGMKKDPIFGVTVIAGLGGIYVEVFRAIDYYIAPLTITEIKHILKNGALKFLFDGTRSEECYNINMIAHVICSVAIIGQENPEIDAIDINPLFIYNDDTADIAVDFKIII